MATKKVNYRALNDELETIMAKLAEPDIDIDEAAKAYERGKAITEELEAYLKNAANTVQKVKRQTNS